MNLNLILLVVFLAFTCSCDQMRSRIRSIEKKAHNLNREEKVFHSLASKNRLLEVEVGKLRAEIATLQAKNRYLAHKMKNEKKKGLRKKTKRRGIASIPSRRSFRDKDLVRFHVYKWNPEQMLAVAQREFDRENYEKSAQFFYKFSMEYPNDSRLGDRFLFQSGIASFKSKKYRDRSKYYFEEIVNRHTGSEYYRSAKVWLSLIHLQNGERGKFFSTVEEFRKKYRNTPEWKILSAYYDEYIFKGRISIL